jgi:hypothetical protein
MNLKNGLKHLDIGNKQVVYESSKIVNKEVSKKPINIIHFNDVYNIEPNEQDPCGGASRFLKIIETIKKETPCLVLFSGDALSPSNSKI